jgi:hypothetical protein
VLDIKRALIELDNEMSNIGASDSIYILGGAALFLLGYESRSTNDVDSLVQVQSGPIFDCAITVSKRLMIDENWLNTSAYPLVRTFNRGWKSNCTLVFGGKSLKVYAVDRQTIINTKLAAACNRTARDLDDLKWLKPTERELDLAKKYILERTKFYGPIEVIEAYIKDILYDQ